MAEVGDDGRFVYDHLDRYWTEPDRHPFLVRVDGRLAGCALVRSGAPHDMAEFFVMRSTGAAASAPAAAPRLFARFPGEWQVRQLAANTGATAFWRTAIPVPFAEDANDRARCNTSGSPDAKEPPRADAPAAPVRLE